MRYTGTVKTYEKRNDGEEQRFIAHGGRHARGRLLLVSRGGLPGAAGCRKGGVRVLGWPRAGPDLQGGVRGEDGTRRGRAGYVRPRGGLVQRYSGGLLHHPRPDDPQPAGRG